MIDLPHDATSITEEFLTDVMGAPIQIIDVTLLEGGVLSEAFRVRIQSPLGDAAMPTSVVVKLTCATLQRRDFAVSVSAYSKELAFYEHLAGEVPIRSPVVYGCRTDGSDTSTGFALVMEDLTAHSRVFDQIDDPPDAHFAQRIAMEAATLHAAYWQSAITDLPWLGQPDGRFVFSLDALSRQAPANAPAFLGLWRTMYGTDLLAATPAVEELTDLLCGPRSDAILDAIYDQFSSRPKTLLHGDMRADNIFRTTGMTHDDVASQLTFIDWQVVHAGPPGPEFTQAWMHSLEPDVRRRDRQMLRVYHDHLVSLNPAASAYTYTMLVDDYIAAFCLWWTALISLGSATFGDFDRPESARMKRLWGKGMNRSVTAMHDLDCLSVVKDICAGLA